MAPIHPVVIKGLIKALRGVAPDMPVAVAANMAGDIVRTLASERISVIPDVLLEPVTDEANALPKDPWDRMVEKQRRVEEAWSEAGRAPWNPPELH